MPIAIKDLTATAGIRTTYSCRAFADNVPDFDTAVVRRVREAGFVIVGKTNTPEFGTVAFTESELNGATANPWNPELTPGGSSGGAAAARRGGSRADRARQRRRRIDPHPVVVLRPLRPEAVARARLERSLLLVRRPLDRRIARALRRGRRRLPRRGLRLRAGRPLVGPAARAPLRGGARSGSRPAPYRGRRDPSDRRTRPRGLHRRPCVPPPRSSRSSATTSATRRRRGPTRRLLDLFLTVWQVGAALYPVPLESLTPLNRGLAEEARSTSSAAYAQASLELQAAARRIVAFWNQFDIVLTPTLALPPVPIGWQEQDVDGALEQLRRNTVFTPFTAVANLTGLPAMSLPLHRSADGLPIGVQAIGPPAGDALLIRLAAQLEEARPWSGERPADLVAQTAGEIRMRCPGSACSMRAALPPEIATDMFP